MCRPLLSGGKAEALVAGNPWAYHSSSFDTVMLDQEENAQCNCSALPCIHFSTGSSADLTVGRSST